MEYLENARDYWRRFRDSRVNEYFDIMRHNNVGGNSGYQYFYRSDEVVQLARDIAHNLEEYYANISIPEGFATPQDLVESWIWFKNFLESKEELFNDITKNIIEKRTKGKIFTTHENLHDYLPEPLKNINIMRIEFLTAINHVLNMDDTIAFLTKNNNTEVAIAADKLSLLCKNFHKFCTQLNRRYNNRSSIKVTDEYDVQDLFHAVLRLHFNDVRAEEYTPSYAAGSSRMDFLISNEKIAIEIKKTRAGLKDKALVDQLIIDIGRYKSHPHCKKLICFVYDPEQLLTNPTGIENDLSDKTGAIEIEVIITPHGK